MCEKHVFALLLNRTREGRALCVLQHHKALSDLLDKPWSQVSSLPPGTCLHFYRAQASAFPLFVDFHRMVLTHALVLSANHFFYARKSPYEYVHSVMVDVLTIYPHHSVNSMDT